MKENAPPTSENRHTYADAGVYPVSLTVTDQTGLSDTKTEGVVVVYDPDDGFVTGGGWIDSPASAYSFMVWAKDDNPDTFRFKVWYETPSGEALVYDNGSNQAIGGGSIVVHPGN